MKIPNLAKPAGAISTAANAAALTVLAPQSVANANPQLDRLTQQALPPRFPWLSLLLQRLEAAAQKPGPFPPASALGDQLDKTA